jgi:hypothetical protein
MLAKVSMADAAAPSTKLPSTVKSATFNILKDINVPKASKEYTSPNSIAPINAVMLIFSSPLIITFFS